MHRVDHSRIYCNFYLSDPEEEILPFRSLEGFTLKVNGRALDSASVTVIQRVGIANATWS